MRQIVAYLAASLDGFIAGPDDDMGWLPEFDGDATGFHDFFKDVGAIAMGRRTYEWIGRHAGDWPYGDVPAYVLSRTLEEGRAEQVTVTPGPVMDLAAALRDGEGIAWLVGGGGLFAAFAAADLIDLWIVTVIPVLLGDGVPLLPARGEAYQRLELAESRTLPGDCVQLHYRPLR
jgi:dihydrofolate reductase